MSDEDTATNAKIGDAETNEPQTEAADTDMVGDEGATDEVGEPASPPSEPGSQVGVRRSRGGVRAWAGVMVLAGCLIASAALAGWLYVYQYRPDQQTDAAAAKVALDAATSGTIALLSYAPDSLDQDFAAAKSRLTGDFLSYYTEFTEQIVTPAAREKSVKTEASVVRAAVSDLQPNSAEVLVFINQTTTSRENPDGAFAASSVKVGLKKIDGAWLIASFDPV
ncbi:MAG: hypothetical protein KDB44_17500 [Mycobacterium sp.]|nr:hypothetical protein [Mycobacterium sp.]